MPYPTFVPESFEMKKRIPINTKDSIYFIVPDEVVYCKSDHSTTTIFLDNGQEVFISMEINDIEKLLEGNSFMRPHHLYLVNRNFIKLVDMANDYTLVLTNQKKIPTSVDRRKEIMDIILKTQNSKLKTQNPKLKTQNWKAINQNGNSNLTV